MIDLRPLAAALATCLALVVAGFVAIILGARVVARTLNVYDQVPAVVSGGVGGLALVLTGCGLALVQVGRACAESERRAAAEVLALLAQQQDARDAGTDDTREFERIAT